MIQILSLPIVLDYLDDKLYGVYLTISSIIMWTHNFDFGLGAGLRFKLSEAFANNDLKTGKELVSSAYVSLALIMLMVGILCTPIVYLINWQDLLNCNILTSEYLALCVLIVMCTLLSQFVLELICTLLLSSQNTSYATVIRPTGHFLSLLCILFLKKYIPNSLLIACIVLTLPTLLVFLVVNLSLFSTKFRCIAPSLSCFRRKHIKSIYSLGLKFFISTLSAAVIFSSSSLIIAHFVYPEDVVVYQTSYTYFAVVAVFQGVVLTPTWSAITDAYVKNDMSWLQRCMKKMHIMTSLFMIMLLMMLLLSDVILEIWLDNKINVPFDLRTWMFIYFCLNLWSSSFNTFTVATGKATISMYVSIFKLISFLPVAIFATKCVGVTGMVLSTIVINTIPNIIFNYIQYHLVISRKAIGIWNR